MGPSPQLLGDPDLSFVAWAPAIAHWLPVRARGPHRQAEGRREGFWPGGASRVPAVDWAWHGKTHTQNPRSLGTVTMQGQASSVTLSCLMSPIPDLLGSGPASPSLPTYQNALCPGQPGTKSALPGT